MVKKILLWAGLAILGVALVGAAVAWAASEVRPSGQEGPAADALAKKMENALNREAWDKTGAVTWRFRDTNAHLWDRRRNLAKITWGDREVLVNLDTQQGIAFQKGKRLTGEEAAKWVEKGWLHWVNDAFWLTAPFKTFDPGVSRSLVISAKGDSALLVSYQSGGNTPGDAYLWRLSPEGKPVSWKMWVSVIPVGGVKVPFDEWTETETGAVLPSGHTGWISLYLTEVKTTFDLQDWYPDTDPFEPLLQLEE